MKLKNIVVLGNLGNRKLPTDVKDTYYLYYKSDSDLYLFDSYRNIEWNLFRLNPPQKGTLSVTVQKAARGVLSVFALMRPKTSTTDNRGLLSVNVLKTPLDPLSITGSIKVDISDFVTGPAFGLLEVFAKTIGAVGTVTINLEDTSLSDPVGTLAVHAQATNSYGVIQLNVADMNVGEPVGALSVHVESTPATGDVTINIADTIVPSSQGTLAVHVNQTPLPGGGTINFYIGE